MSIYQVCSWRFCNSADLCETDQKGTTVSCGANNHPDMGRHDKLTMAFGTVSTLFPFAFGRFLISF